MEGDGDEGRETLPAPPKLPTLDRAERAALDYTLVGLSAGRRPMSLHRQSLRRRDVYTIAE